MDKTAHTSAPNPLAEGLILTKPLVLIGLMGVGKTTIGKRLAAQLGLSFVDADEEIEKAAGQTVSDIFASLGEAGFRDGEQRVIARLLDGEPMVIATGGGAMTLAQTRKNIKQKSISLWLKTDLDIIARRVAHKTHRPLLKDRDPMEVLRQQAKARYPLYGHANLTVNTGDNSHARTVDLVLSALKAYLETRHDTNH